MDKKEIKKRINNEINWIWFILMIWFLIWIILIVFTSNQKVEKQKEKIIIEKQNVIVKYIYVPQIIEVEKYIEIESEVKTYDLSESDIELLRKIVMWEAQSEPFMCKQMVCQTVLDRVESEDFPNTIYEVIYQNKQFSGVNSTEFDNIKPNPDSIYAVQTILDGSFKYDHKTPLYFETLSNPETFKKAHNYLFQIGKTRFYN